MGGWQRLSARHGGTASDGPYEGMPPHLRAPILDWVSYALTKPDPGKVARAGYAHPRIVDPQLLTKVALACRIGLPVGALLQERKSALLDACRDDDEACLDVVDALLHLADNPLPQVLTQLLEEGGSVWTVASDGKSLQAKVDESAVATFNEAASLEDLASQELREAWSRAYGRNPDPSDAWDHAIKAVEVVLAPIVVPKQDKPQLGHVIGQLDRQPEGWRLVLPGPDQDHAVAPLVTILKTLWPNPDRHGSGNPRTPALDEARAVVHLAALIVQWARSGALSRR